MTPRQLRWVAALWTAATVAALMAGFDHIGAVAALFLTCGLAGAPLAVLAGGRLPTSAVAVLAVAVSLAETALVSQALVWLSWAGRSPIVAATGAYAVALALLVERHGAGAGEPDVAVVDRADGGRSDGAGAGEPDVAVVDRADGGRSDGAGAGEPDVAGAGTP